MVLAGDGCGWMLVEGRRHLKKESVGRPNDHVSERGSVMAGRGGNPCHPERNE